MTDDDLIHELNELIQLDYDASRTYEHALQHVGDEQARADLQAFMRDHLQHMAELRTVILELGGAPLEPSRDLKGVLLEGMTKLRSVTGTMGALKAMRMNEKLTNRTYDRASELDLPPRARTRSSHERTARRATAGGGQPLSAGHTAICADANHLARRSL